MRLGYDFAGTCLFDGDDAAGAVAGPGTASFPRGTRVWGMLDTFKGGACAEVLNVSKKLVSVAPDGITLTEAAALPLVSLTALQSLRDCGRLRPGGSVLIHGASGGVGSAAVQIARALGAGRVAATASAERADFLRSLGADDVFDYTQFPGGKLSMDVPGAPYDIVLDVFGNGSLATAAPLLRPRGGVYVTLVPSSRNFRDVFLTHLPCFWWWRRAELTIVATRNDLPAVRAMVEKGQLRAIIDTEYPLECVADAHKHVEGKHTKGKVVVVMPAPRL